METEFEKRLQLLINEFSKENDSDTPDFILAKYLNECLDNFNAAVKQREQWYGREKHFTDLPDAPEPITQPIDYDSTGNPPDLKQTKTNENPDLWNDSSPMNTFGNDN